MQKTGTVGTGTPLQGTYSERDRCRSKKAQGTALHMRRQLSPGSHSAHVADTDGPILHSIRGREMGAHEQIAQYSVGTQ